MSNPQSAARQANNDNAAALVAQANAQDRVEGILQTGVDAFNTAPAAPAVTSEAVKVTGGLKALLAGALNRLLGTTADFTVPAPAGAVPACGGGGCVTADIFADCMEGFTGGLPADGWTVVAGTIPVKRGGCQTVLLPTASSTSNRIQKALLTSAPLVDLTGQFDFSEFADEDGSGNTFYEMNVAPANPLDAITAVYLDDSGTALIAGPGVLIGGFNAGLGTWTPTPGATRRCHWQIEADGTPHIFIDGTEIVLTGAAIFTATGLSDLAQLETSYGGSSPPSIAGYCRAFVNNGVDPASTSYCCP